MRKVNTKNFISISFRVCGGAWQRKLSLKVYPDIGVYKFGWQGILEYPKWADDVSGIRGMRRIS